MVVQGCRTYSQRRRLKAMSNDIAAAICLARRSEEAASMPDEPFDGSLI